MAMLRLRRLLKRPNECTAEKSIRHSFRDRGHDDSVRLESMVAYEPSVWCSNGQVRTFLSHRATRFVDTTVREQEWPSRWASDATQGLPRVSHDDALYVPTRLGGYLVARCQPVAGDSQVTAQPLQW